MVSGMITFLEALSYNCTIGNSSPKLCVIVLDVTLVISSLWSGFTLVNDKPLPWNEPEKLLLINAEAEICPSTDKLESFKSCNESLLNLAVITLEPAFLFANSIRPSSEPSEASWIFAVIFAYTTSWSASFSPLNFNCPK